MATDTYDPFLNPESEHADRIVSALVTAGLVSLGERAQAYNIVCRVLHVCQYCRTVLLPDNTPIYCDSFKCEDKVSNGEPPEEEDGNDDGSASDQG